jgi:hypothetical protein
VIENCEPNRRFGSTPAIENSEANLRKGWKADTRSSHLIVASAPKAISVAKWLFPKDLARMIPQYLTGLWTFDEDAFPSPCPVFSGDIKTDSGFVRGTQKQLAKLLELSIEARGMAPVYIEGPIDQHDGTFIQRLATEIKIEAPNRLVAQRIFNLVRASSAVLAGNVRRDWEDWVAIPTDPKTSGDLTEEEAGTALRCQHLGAHGFNRACFMASNVCRRRFLQYAVYKLFQSLCTASAPSVEQDPRYAPRKFGVEADAMAHVIFATAITLAYSSIEEMQLESRGSKDHPSTNPDGTWNQKNLEELLKRLMAKKINANIPILWTLRGPPTRIERKGRYLGGVKASWTRGTVRDKQVSIVDALRNASWLRSSITTHKFNQMTSSLTLYDVLNVQTLARRLIMEHLGLW